MPDILTISIEQNMRFQGGICPEKFQLDQIQMADLWPLLSLIWVISGKPCQIARPSLQNKIVGFREGDTLKNFNSIKFQMADL